MKSPFFSKSVIIATTATVVASGIGTYVWRAEHRPPVLELYVFNLKNSQSIFIRTPDDRRILINGGGNSEVIRYISKVLPFYSRRIDSIVATDLFDKNISGLIDVTERYHISSAYIPGVTLESLGMGTSTDKATKPFMRSLKKHSILLRELIVDGEIDTGEFVTTQTVFPVTATTFEYSKASAPEIILKLTHGSNTFVLGGQASKKIQKFISTSTQAEPELKGDRVFIVSASGGATELSEDLFEKYDPTHFLFSKAVSYKLPKEIKKKIVEVQVTNRSFEKINVREFGGVKLVSDGKKIRVSPLYWN